MRAIHLLIPTAGLTVWLGATSLRPAQQTEAPYWYISTYSVDWRQVDSLQSLFRNYTLPIAEEAKKEGKLLDYKILIHNMGNEWNVVLARKYRSWDDIDDAVLMPATRKLFPDSADRARVNAAFGEIYQGGAHRDAIYREVTPQ